MEVKQIYSKLLFAIFFATLVLFVTSFYSKSFAKAIDGDFSENLINIDASFTGKEILLFGVKNGYGDLLVVVRGPKKSYDIYKKEKLFNKIWISKKKASFSDVYTFYNVYSNKPLEKISSPTLLKKLGIGSGIENISINEQKIEISSLGELSEFKSAIVRNKEKYDLYKQNDKEGINFTNSSLFKLKILFPKKIEEGLYTAEIYLMNNDMLSGVQIIPIEVKKIGFEAFIHNIATEHKLLYGIIAVLLALTAGWIASVIFWKK